MPHTHFSRLLGQYFSGLHRELIFPFFFLLGNKTTNDSMELGSPFRWSLIFHSGKFSEYEKIRKMRTVI